MYVVFAAVCVSCAWFAWRFMPETKGLSLEAIGEFWRARGEHNGRNAREMKAVG
jgi:hypothetical protein